MRLPCPLCGERDHSEFVYRGDANVVRPDAEAPGAQRAFHEFVHLRANPAGWHKEHWYHEMGCRSWIVVERNTLTHEVRGAVTAAEHTLARRPAPVADEGGR
ncbi:MAG: sarcosine oxidase subunit delta [Alphaproteobacteria bacterium]|nr:MAG: sarcosine oxidase subunit delta [Alphaproteobacteria bacterium]